MLLSELISKECSLLSFFIGPVRLLNFISSSVDIVVIIPCVCARAHFVFSGYDDGESSSWKSDDEGCFLSFTKPEIQTNSICDRQSFSVIDRIYDQWKRQRKIDGWFNIRWLSKEIELDSVSNPSLPRQSDMNSSGSARLTYLHFIELEVFPLRLIRNCCSRSVHLLFMLVKMC